MDMRKCVKCGEVKPLDAFYLSNGYREHKCKECRKAASTEYFKAHRDRINAQRRENYANCPRIRAYYRERNIRRKLEEARSL